MAFTTILTTDTLESMRQKINNLTQNDFGDPALLTSAGLSATSVIGAVVELNSIVTSAAGFFVEDETSTIQTVGPGQTLRVLSGTNVTAAVSVPDTVTFDLQNDVSIVNDLSVGNNISASGTTHTLGTIEIGGNTIRSVDSSQITINDSLQVNGPLRAGATTINPAGFNNIESTTGFTVFGSSIVLNTNRFIVFEGSTDNLFETTLNVVDPTTDRSINLPDVSGTLITTGDTGTVTSSMILNGTITGTDIAADTIAEANIADDAIGQDQLKSVVTLQIINSSGGVVKTLYGAGA
jgi:hypothetical protein